MTGRLALAALVVPALLAAQAAPDSTHATAAAHDSAQAPPAPQPFAFADFTWLQGNPRSHQSVLDSKYFTGEFRVDVSYIGDFNHPSDHTLVGTSEPSRRTWSRSSLWMRAPSSPAWKAAARVVSQASTLR